MKIGSANYTGGLRAAKRAREREGEREREKERPTDRRRQRITENNGGSGFNLFPRAKGKVAHARGPGEARPV
jgi:hypothetical protein